MSVCLLVLGSADDTTNEDIVGLQLNVLEHAVLSFVDDNSQLVRVERGRVNGMCGSCHPLLLLDKVDKGL